jgi:hypothetical protein
MIKSIFIIVAVLIFSNCLKAQKIFINTNNELCIELYKIEIANGEGLVYMVIDNENPLERNDSLIFMKWSSLKQSEQSKCVQKWTSLGKRIEIENFPCYQIVQKQQTFIKAKNKQNEKENINIFGCWQTVKYTNAKEEVVYPPEVIMIYKFYSDDKYEMLISNGFTKQKKVQIGTFKFATNNITLVSDGGVPFTDNVSFIDVNNFTWDVLLNNEKGKFQLKRIQCED